MGRPPLHKSGTVGIHLKVSVALRKRIKEALNGDTESSFIRKAIEAELKKRERKR